jgi:hypothetical protein
MMQATVYPSSTTRCGTPESLRRPSGRYSEALWGSIRRMVHVNFGEFPFYELQCIKENGSLGRRWRGLLQTSRQSRSISFSDEHQQAAYSHRRTEDL